MSDLDPDLLDQFIKAWLDHWLEENLEDWLKENFSKLRPALERVQQEVTFENIQEHADMLWKDSHHDGLKPVVGDEVPVGGYSSGRSYVREVDVDRKQVVWALRYRYYA